MWPEGKKKRRVGELATTSTLSGEKQRRSETEVRKFTAAAAAAAAEEIPAADGVEARQGRGVEGVLARP